MPTLNVHYVLYTDGTPPRPAQHPDFSLTALPAVPQPDESEEFFGPFAQIAHEQIRTARAAFWLRGKREVRGSVGEFFSQVQAEVAHCVEGHSGFVVDLLKMWALPFADVAELPSDPLAEDLFAVSFQEKGRDLFLARTYGLGKLEQAEVSFQFRGHELTDEAATMCSHLAEYAMTQSRRVSAGQSMTFGYDALIFRSSATEDSSPPLLRRVAGAALRRTPLLLAHACEPMSEDLSADLTDALRRSFDQRLVLEEQEVAGDAPHQTTELKLCPCAGTGEGLRGWREEPASARESGWTFTCRHRHQPAELEQLVLGTAVQRLPQILRFLALPPGSSLQWQGDRVLVDAAGQTGADDDESNSSDSGSWRRGP